MPNVLPTANDVPTTRELQQRLDGMAEAVRLVQATVDRMPTPAIVQAHLETLEVLVDQRFVAERELTMKQFEANKELVLTTFRSSETALAAALAARREATDDVRVNIRTLHDALAKTVDDLKDRINRTEGAKRGIGEIWAIFIGVAGVAAALAAIFVNRLH